MTLHTQKKGHLSKSSNSYKSLRSSKYPNKSSSYSLNLKSKNIKDRKIQNNQNIQGHNIHNDQNLSALKKFPFYKIKLFKQLTLKKIPNEDKIKAFDSFKTHKNKINLMNPSCQKKMLSKMGVIGNNSKAPSRVYKLLLLNLKLFVINFFKYIIYNLI
jgi:hypothetical protein